MEARKPPTEGGPVPTADKEEDKMENVNEIETQATETPAAEAAPPALPTDDVIAAAIAAAKAKRSGEKKRVIKVQSAEEREAAAAQKVADREARKAQRDAAREARRAAKEAKPAAHLKKVEKAAALLPALGEGAAAALEAVRRDLSADQQLALAAHLQHAVRAERTARAANLHAELAVGTRVRVTGGDPRFIGAEGTVAKSQRIRCLVEVPGKAKPLYLFTSDVEAIEAAPEAPAAEQA